MILANGIRVDPPKIKAVHEIANTKECNGSEKFYGFGWVLP